MLDCTAKAFQAEKAVQCTHHWADGWGLFFLHPFPAVYKNCVNKLLWKTVCLDGPLSTRPLAVFIWLCLCSSAGCLNLKECNVTKRWRCCICIAPVASLFHSLLRSVGSSVPSSKSWPFKMCVTKIINGSVLCPWCLFFSSHGNASFERRHPIMDASSIHTVTVAYWFQLNC